MASPANVEPLGWLKRIFGGPTDDRAKRTTNTSPTTSTESSITRKRVLDVRNLINQLSPTSSKTNKPTGKSLRSLDSPVATLLKNVNSDSKQDGGKRKRLSSDEEKPSPLEDIFTQTQTTAKRFRGSDSNNSLIADSIKVLIPGIDMTWSGDTTSGENTSNTPSVRSLKSRLSGPTNSSTSGLSSRTRSILQQLEKVHTPASEARRLPTVRRHSVASERWSHVGLNSPGAPPLRRTKNVFPTRLQLLSTLVGQNKKPYWKDIYRKPAEKVPEQEVSNKDSVDNSNLDGSMLAPILDVPETQQNNITEEPRVSRMKGTDGISRNVFNTKALEEEEELNTLPIPTPVPLKMTAPIKGFLGDLNFTFDLPKERPAQITEPEKEDVVCSSSSEEDSDDDEESDATSASSVKETPSLAKESPNILQTVSETKKPASPPSAPVPSAATVTQSEKWDCSACFVSNTGDKCVCCGTSKEGKEAASASKKELVSNISTFAKPTTSVSFGFGVKKTESALVPNAESKADDGKRYPWDCPDCMVSNKAENDSCPCCGHVKYKSASTGTASIFGSNAFKPTPSNSTVSFGLSGGATKTYSFGFGSKPSEPEPLKEDTVKAVIPVGVAPTPSPFSASSTAPVVPSICVPDASKNTTVPSDRPSSSLFGSSTLTFGQSTSATSAPVSTAPVCSTAGVSPFDCLVKPAETTTAPATLSLFGSNPSTSSFPSDISLPNPFDAKPLGSATTSLFGFKPEVTSAPSTSLFGLPQKEVGASATAPATTSSAFDFGASSSTSSTQVNGNLFGASQDKPLFGSSATALTPSPFSGSVSSAPAFGCLSQPAPVRPAVPMFGGASTANDEPTAKKPMFSFGESSAGPALTFGQSSSAGNLFGNSASSVFGSQSGSSPFGAPAPPSLSTSSSTNSLFAASLEPPTSFNFGGTSAAGSNQAFVFGSGAPAAPAMNVGQAAPSVPGGSFAYAASSSSTGGGITAAARKIATARRRVTGRR